LSSYKELYSRFVDKETRSIFERVPINNVPLMICNTSSIERMRLIILLYRRSIHMKEENVSIKQMVPDLIKISNPQILASYQITQTHFITEVLNHRELTGIAESKTPPLSCETKAVLPKGHVLSTTKGMSDSVSHCIGRKLRLSLIYTF
ncbi:hypothetical protein SK128_022832, partial [Halocaridina rubra]